MPDPYTVEIDLDPTVLGDQWTGINPIGPVVVNGISQGTLSRISMWFVGPGGIYKLDSNGTGDGLIVITNAGTWLAHISPITKFLPQAGEWNWDMKFYSDGDISPITCYSGVLTVLPTTDP